MAKTPEISENFLSVSDPPTLQGPTISPNVVGDHHDQSTTGIYLELPTLSRRRRSYQVSVSSDDAEEKEKKEDDEELFDSPRLFTEILCLSEELDSEPIWREASRWVRFEEDVDEDGERWMKPRVSSLSVHSFFELRSFLLNGVLELDLRAKTYPKLLESLQEKITAVNKLRPDQIINFKNVLRKNCRHLFQLGKSDEKIGSENYEGNINFLKKLPKGSEAANIMVGEVEFLDDPVCCFVRLDAALNLGRLTEVPLSSRFVFILLGPTGDLGRYYEIARCMATLLSDEVFREVAYRSQIKTHILAGVDEFLDASTLLPPGEWDPATRIEPPENVPTKASRKKESKEEEFDEEEQEHLDREAAGLVRTGRLFGGFIDDIKRKRKFFISDFVDGIAVQSLASFFFIYFACLTPIITFGGLLGEATGGNIAVMESLVSGLICGVSYGLLSGQPLTIMGSTGPVLVFESILYSFCSGWGWNYLSFRLWIGIWATVILLLLVAVEASALVCYITRFTEEGFATLIGLIYIIKAFEKLIKIAYPHHHDNEEYEDIPKDLCDNCTLEDTTSPHHISARAIQEMQNMTNHLEEVGHFGCSEIFLFSIILFFGTFIISMGLKNFRTKPFFPNLVRDFVSDFAVIIAIASMALLDYLVGIDTPKLIVPSEFKPTRSDRGWIVPLFNGNPWWTCLVAFIPALLVCILLFMDQQITAVIVNRKEHKLKKGGGYHLDLTIVAVLVGVTSVMGLPWFVAATVLSINHVNSLKLESQTSAPGEKPQFLGVRENRVTHVLIFLVIGLSVFLTSVLQMIPMPVLFGVFLYMGIASLNGIQFFERILIMFMPEKYQPDLTYLRKIPMARVHIYTTIQLLCVVLLWVIKSFPQTSILFPLMLVVIVFVRKLLDFVFTQRELKILDDCLPEFSRKKILEEEDEDDDDIKKESDASMPLVNGATLSLPPPINITDESNNSTLFQSIDIGIIPPSSAGSSRRSSFALAQRRRSSAKPPNITDRHNDGSHNTITIPGSGIHSRRMSSLGQRRQSSILEPIFGATHHYNCEGGNVLGIPGNLRNSRKSTDDEQTNVTNVSRM